MLVPTTSSPKSTIPGLTVYHQEPMDNDGLFCTYDDVNYIKVHPCIAVREIEPHFFCTKGKERFRDVMGPEYGGRGHEFATHPPCSTIILEFVPDWDVEEVSHIVHNPKGLLIRDIVDEGRKIVGRESVVHF